MLAIACSLGKTVTVEFFSPSYSVARSRLMSAAEDCGARTSSIRHDEVCGIDSEELFVDVLALGPADADKVVVIGSGTHGVEGFCGSACQLGLLTRGLHAVLPRDTSLLLVHAMNPFGFSHCRRVNEDNIDINRNFVEPGTPQPENPDYEALHRHLVPADWFGDSRAEADACIQTFIRERGERAYQAALTRGQYTHANGIFYGGAKPCWSNLTWQTIVRECLSGKREILHIDVHTGIGPFGYGEPILVDASYDDSLDLALCWFGNGVTSLQGDECVSAVVQGPISNALRWHLPTRHYMALSLEYGTRPVQQALDALRADNWLYLQTEFPEGRGREIKAQIRDAFYIEERRWMEMVWDRFEEIFLRAFDGFAQHRTGHRPSIVDPTGR